MGILCETFEEVTRKLCTPQSCKENSSQRMATNTALLGLVIGAYPSISDKEFASKKLIPTLLLTILIAFLDWADDDTWWFMLATATSHWVFSQDYPNLLVDTAFNAIKGLATKCCSSAYCHLCDYADSLFSPTLSSLFRGL